MLHQRSYARSSPILSALEGADDHWLRLPLW